MEIRAAVVREPGLFSVEPVELAAPRGDEVLVRLVATGMCHTDIAALDRSLPYPLPAVLGHEGAGVVDKVGPGVTRLRPGDPVVLSYAWCGACPACLGGRAPYCTQARQLNLALGRPDGSRTHYACGHALCAGFFGQSSFATHALVAERQAVVVPHDLDVASLAPLGCGVQTGAGGVLNVLRPQAGSSIVVFGMGAVGLSAVMAARLSGCTTIVAVDLHPARLDLAHELGATHLVRASTAPVVDAVQAVAPGGLDHAVEATGVPAVVGQAIASTHRTGSTVLLGMAGMGARIELDAALLLSGRTVRGSIEGDAVPGAFIPRLIELHRTGRLPFERMCRHYRLDDINQAVEDCRSGAVVKPVIRMD